MDPFKNIDPKQQGRVKNRILELHGTGSAGYIPDSDLPWSQNERENSFGNQGEMSTFGLPQKGSMIKARHHGDSKYSPLFSGSPYSSMGRIKEWTSSLFGGAHAHTAASDGGGGGSAGGDSGFNQKDHYGHKDPLGNLIHFDMKSKTLNVDFSFLSECKFKFPKTSINTVDTNWNRKKGTFEGGSPTSIQGMSSGGGASAGTQASGQDGDSQTGGDTVKGDITFTISGQHQNTVQGKVTETFNDEHSVTVDKDVTNTHKQNHTLNVGQTYTKNVGASNARGDGPAKIVIKQDGSRSDKYAQKWSSQAQNMVWSWLTSRNTISG
jgi:hypothetical protein